MSTVVQSERIAVTGATGLVGRAVCVYLRKRGGEVIPVIRRPVEPGRMEIAWDPSSQRIDARAMEGLDVVIHLAGENIAAGRWTADRKREIRASRIEGTRLLCSTLATLARPPRVIICASAVGYYGDRGSEWIDEDSTPGTGFLAGVCRDWEAATDIAREAGIRVVNLRLGMVLSRGGGVLPKMVRPFRWGLGGNISNGRQYMSWITLDDLIDCIHFLAHDDAVNGPVNAVAPQPVTNAEWTATLGKILNRPTIVPLPAFIIKLFLGEMGQELLLQGARVRPSRLKSHGFVFRYPDLESSLRFMLKV